MTTPNKMPDVMHLMMPVCRDNRTVAQTWGNERTARYTSDHAIEQRARVAAKRWLMSANADSKAVNELTAVIITALKGATK